MAIEETQQQFLKRLAKGISSMYGSNCEVVIHDLTSGYENTIIAIENGHISGRHVGDDASEIVLQTLKQGKSETEDHYNYLTRTKDGKMLKSSSVFIRDEKEEVIGLFCINYDVSDLMMANVAINAVIGAEPEVNGSGKSSGKGSIDTITTNISELLDQLIEDSTTYVGKPVSHMTKEDKIKAIQFLDEQGAFLITKSGDKVAKHYGISKYTLYNYMGSKE